MTEPRKKTLRDLAKEKTRQAVIDSATQQFAEKGYVGATIRDIAKGCGMSTGAVFANFQDKAALYEEIHGHQPIMPEHGALAVHLLRALTINLKLDPLHITETDSVQEAFLRLRDAADVVLSLTRYPPLPARTVEGEDLQDVMLWAIASKPIEPEAPSHEA